MLIGILPSADASGMIAANDIAATIDFMNQQPFIDADNTTVVGVSTGGWASLAVAARNLPSARAVVNVADGRGGHAYGRANAVCGAERLVDAACLFSLTARVPTLWFYSENDSYFAPRLARRLARTWGAGGASAEQHVLPPYGRDGHDIADDQAGWGCGGRRWRAFWIAPRGAPRSVIKMADGVEMKPTVGQQ